jgi:hypothetical protein
MTKMKSGDALFRAGGFLETPALANTFDDPPASLSRACAGSGGELVTTSIFHALRVSVLK